MRFQEAEHAGLEIRIPGASYGDERTSLVEWGVEGSLKKFLEPRSPRDREAVRGVSRLTVLPSGHRHPHPP